MISLPCRLSNQDQQRSAARTAWSSSPNYLELLNRDPLLAPVQGIIAAQEMRPQARVLAEDRASAASSSTANRYTAPVTVPSAVLTRQPGSPLTASRAPVSAVRRWAPGCRGSSDRPSAAWLLARRGSVKLSRLVPLGSGSMVSVSSSPSKATPATMPLVGPRPIAGSSTHRAQVPMKHADLARRRGNAVAGGADPYRKRSRPGRRASSCWGRTRRRSR